MHNFVTITNICTKNIQITKHNIQKILIIFLGLIQKFEFI